LPQRQFGAAARALSPAGGRILARAAGDHAPADPAGETEQKCSKRKL
jgi:hypothetical protein